MYLGFKSNATTGTTLKVVRDCDSHNHYKISAITVFGCRLPSPVSLFSLCTYIPIM